MNRKQKRFVQIYIFLALFTFIVLNWNDVSWLFNYRVLGGLADDFFTPYENSELLVSANNSADSARNYPYSNKSNSIEIPSLQITAPLVIGQNTNLATLLKDLDKGVVYYPGSVLFGEKGHITLLGHSAPPNWPHIKYDWVFTNINNLQPGETVVVHFNNTKYTYAITNKTIIEKGEEINITGVSKDENVLTMVSCWPPGKDYQRIAVQAKLLKN